MRIAPRFAVLAAILITAGAIVSFSPLQAHPAAAVFLSPTKLAGLLVGGAAALAVFRRFGRGEPERRPWLVLGVGLLLMAAGQSVLAYYQVAQGVSAPFPSAGDPFFVVAATLLVWALAWFTWLTYRSGLLAGSAVNFWSPGIAVAVAFLVTGYPILAPIVSSPATTTELFLNIFYPVASFLSLAPLAVLLRLGVRFRGGRLIMVWLPLTIGFACMLVSDVFFAYYSTLGMTAFRSALSYLYLVGYLLVPVGVFAQLDLLRG